MQSGSPDIFYNLDVTKYKGKVHVGQSPDGNYLAIVSKDIVDILHIPTSNIILTIDINNPTHTIYNVEVYNFSIVLIRQKYMTS